MDGILCLWKKAQGWLWETWTKRQVDASLRTKGEGERQRLPIAFAIAKGEKEMETQDSSSA